MQELHGISLTGYEKFMQPEKLIHKQELLFEWTLTSDVDSCRW